MYLQNLTLHNFKCFDELSVQFQPKLTVIVGINGSGKTSILEGAAIALSTMFVKMDGISGKSINKNQAHLKAYDAGSTKDVQPQYPVVVGASAVVKSGKKTWERSLNTPSGNMTVGKAKDIINLGMHFQEHLRDGDTELILPVVAYYGTGRLWDYHREKQDAVFETNNRMNGYIDCMDGTANLKLMMNWFTKMTIQKYQNQEVGLGGIPELDAVYAAMETCYRKITGCQNVKMQYNLGTKELEAAYWDDAGNFMRIPISQLSDGYKCTISLVADIAYRMAVLNPQLLDKVCTQTDGIILIDEVDLHLHPTWQQRILEDLTDIFPKVQFIVSTHAPAVVNTVKSKNIVLLDGGKVCELGGELYGRDVNTTISAMGADERPTEIKQLFHMFYRCVDNRNVEEAEYVLNQLKTELDETDPEINSCEVKLKLLKFRSGK